MLCLCRVENLGKQVIKLLIFLLAQVSLYLGHRYPGLFSQEEWMIYARLTKRTWNFEGSDRRTISQFASEFDTTDAGSQMHSTETCHIFNASFMWNSAKSTAQYTVYYGVWRASRAVRILQCWTKRTISVCLLLSVKSALLGSVTAAILHTNTQK